MRALVVYESMFGATHEIAEAIAEGLRAELDHVDVRSVADADAVRVADADLLVVGGPTHVHGMSRPKTRHAAATQPGKYREGGTPLEPHADGPGLREWFDALAPTSHAAAAFDTRADVSAVLSGRASNGIARRLRTSGCRLVDQPRSFLVAKGGALKAGEADRAQGWGRSLARASGRRPGDGEPSPSAPAHGA